MPLINVYPKGSLLYLGDWGEVLGGAGGVMFKHLRRLMPGYLHHKIVGNGSRPQDRVQPPT